jgi:hypothetical protein
MTRRCRAGGVASRRSHTSNRAGTRALAHPPAPSGRSPLVSVVETAQRDPINHASPAIKVRSRREGSVGPGSAPDWDADVPGSGPAVPAVTAPASWVALAARPVTAPGALLRRQPFRRHIEESRPYLVLSEGMRMINAHPIAVMVFWGGFSDWVLGFILAGHHTASAVRLSIYVAVVFVWLLTTLARIGKLREVGESIRAIRALPVGPAVWTGLKRPGGLATGRPLPAPEAHLLYFVRRPERALIPADRSSCRNARATSPEHVQLARRGRESGSARQGEEYSS